jgi:aspartate/methionine/tyrosine aminotransferase
MSYSPRLSRRVARVQAFHVMELLARARAEEAKGRDIVHMEMGEPDFPAPPAVVAAAHRALEQDLTHYSPALGLPSLREAISAYYRQHYGLDIASQRIIVTPGSSGALQLVMAALLDAGDEILMPDPAYPCNRQIATVLGARTISIPVDAATAYQPSPSQVSAAWTERTRGLMLATPSNPCGSVLDIEALRSLSEVTRAGGGQLVVDEIYHGLSYGIDLPCALQADDSAYVINSFSKYFGMTGFRLGWLVAPPASIAAIERLAQNLFISASTLAQHAALAAFEPETLALLEQRRQEFGRRRDYLLPALRELGFGIPRVPEGAFYIYADASRFTTDSEAFAHELLEKAGVVITPGIDFGSHQASHHVRFAYSSSLARLEEGIDRLSGFLRAGS